MPRREQRASGPVIRQAGSQGLIELAPDPDRPGAWTLLVDGTPQSHVDLADPRHLEFEYMRRLGHLADLAAPDGEPLRVLHLGAGGLTLARYVAATRPGSRQLAVDSDAALVELVREQLPFGPRGRGRGGSGRAGVRVRVGDALTALAELPDGEFGMVVADLFAGGSTPAHLTTAEFTAAAARVLSPPGVFAVNVGDGPPLAYARAQAATIRSVFPHSCLLAESAVLRGRRFGNLVLAASGQELPVARLTRLTAGDPFPARLLHGAELDRFTAGARPLTGSHAQPSPRPPGDLFDRSRP